MKKHPHKITGFTLFELLIVIAIIGVLCAIALPNFQMIKRKMAFNSIVVEFYQSLQMARNQAMRRQQVITVCGSLSYPTCDGQWNSGYLIFQDLNRNGQRDVLEKNIKFKRIKDKIRVTWTSFLSGSYLQFDPNGFTLNQNGTFQFTMTINHQTVTRSIVIAKSGNIHFKQK